MQVSRQPEETGRYRGQTSAAGLSATWSRLVSVRKVLLLGMLGVAVLCLAIFATAASATPTYREQIGSLEAQAEDLQTQIADLDLELEVATEAYNEMVVKLNELNVTMTILRQQKDLAQTDYQYRLRLYEDRLCDLYKAGGHDEFLEMILDADDVDDFIARATLAAELAAQDRRLMDNLTQSADRLEEVLADIDQTKSQELTIRRQMTDEKDRIEATLKTRTDTLAGVDSQIAVVMEAERQRQAEEQVRLQEALARLLNGGQVYGGTLPETEDEILNQFLQTAAKYLGVPYVWGGERPSAGLDCSGYTQLVYRQHGVRLPHYSGYQAVMGLPVDLANIMPGDLLAFGFPVCHVGIYVGEDLFIHAAGTGKGVRIGQLSTRNDLSAIRRFDLKPRTGEPAFF